MGARARHLLGAPIQTRITAKDGPNLINLHHLLLRVCKWRQKCGIRSRDYGWRRDSSGESTDWPNFREDPPEIMDILPPFSTGIYPDPNHD